MQNWLKDRGKWLRQFNKKEYAAAFKAYQEDCRFSVERLNQDYLAGRGEVLQAAAAGLLEQVEQECRCASGSSPKTRRDCAYLIVCYLIPCLRSLALPCSEPLEQQILEAWNRAYPGQPLRGGSFEQIQAGFPSGSLFTHLFRNRKERHI